MIRRGTIGSHRYYCISFRRHNPEQMILVADRQGRIRHVSASLAKLLDTTVEHLQVSPGVLSERWLRVSYQRATCHADLIDNPVLEDWTGWERSG